MNNNAAIEAIFNYTTIEGKAVSEVKTTLNYPINYGHQPSSVSWIIDYNENLKVGDTIDVSDDKFNYLYMLDNGKFGVWEFLGSDHNSMIAYYGASHEIDSIMLQLQNANEQMLPRLGEGDLDITSPVTFRWDFDNDMSLCFYYVDTFYSPFEEYRVKSNNVITVFGGGHTDDILTSEVLMLPLAKMTKKIKLNTEEESEFGLDDFSDYEEAILVNGKAYKKQHEHLLIGISHAIFCDLLNAHNMTESNTENSDDYDENLVMLSKKLIVLKKIKELVAPTNNDSVHLTFESESSNKEYKIHFNENNAHYKVSVAYGKIGTNLKEEVKYEGTDLALAQKEYLTILSEKLAKGYQQKSATPSFKM